MKSPFYFILTLILSICSLPQIFSQLSLPGLFADNMVLQRNAKVQFWGKANPSTIVSIQTPWNQYEGKTNPSGEWKITITTPDIQEAFSIIVCNQKDCLTINNILLGEVWLASGQSNMEMPLRGWLPNDPILNAEEEIQNAQNYPIRFFTVHKGVSTQPLSGLKGTWELPQAEHAANFSATAFFFAQELVQELNVPVGIIHSSWGGTPVESWIGESGMRSTGYYTSLLDQLPETEKRQKTYENWLSSLNSFASPLAANLLDWSESTQNLWRELPFNDIQFANPLFDDQDWPMVNLPGDYIPSFSEELQLTSNFDGIVWIRHTFHLDTVAGDFKMELGAVDDMEFTYINGIFVGGSMGPGSFTEKTYTVPKNILKKGVNTIAIRIIDTGGASSMSGPLELTHQDYKVPLTGKWKALPTAELYKGDFYALDPLDPFLTKRPIYNKLTASTPTALFNAMINPLIPYTIKGAIWYQGESNVGAEEKYEVIFKQMIEDWRSQWGFEFPFYFTQIAPFDYQNNLSPALRHAQLKVTTVPNTGMAVTLDIGNPKNIHPADKKSVGQRLAALAFANTYDLPGRVGALQPKSVVQNQYGLEITFDCNAGRITYLESQKNELEISEDNIKFYPAAVQVENCTLILSSSKIQKPKYVRHAWSDTATGAIYNHLNIPIATFYLEAVNN